MEFHGHSCQSPEERDKLVREKIAKEDEMEAQATGDSRLITRELLEKLGYADSEIEVDFPFEVSSGKHSGVCSTDYIIRIDGRRYMAVKCSMALESRERHIISFCRAADTPAIPIAVITDGLTAHVLDTFSGQKVLEGLDNVPGREDALAYLRENPDRTYPPDRAEKERRVLLAFETTLCPRPENK